MFSIFIKMALAKMSLFRNIFSFYRSLLIPRASPVPRRRSSDVRDALCICEAPKLDNKTVLLEKREAQERERHQGSMTVCTEPDITPLTGVPEEHVSGRRVRIFELSKDAMQSGTDNAHGWRIEFDARDRWENPLMGWASSGDPLGNMKIYFPTEKEAIAFCDKNRWRWFLADRPDRRSGKKGLRPGSYATNYSWDKRSRVSTK